MENNLPNVLIFAVLSKITEFFKDDKNNKRTVTINKMLASHGNKEIITMMRGKCMKIKLRSASASTCHMEENLHYDACEPSLVFLNCTARIRELPGHSQNLRNDLQCYGKFHNEEFQKLVKILI